MSPTLQSREVELVPGLHLPLHNCAHPRKHSSAPLCTPLSYEAMARLWPCERIQATATQVSCTVVITVDLLGHTLLCDVEDWSSPATIGDLGGPDLPVAHPQVSGEKWGG